jgi:putative glycosyltransferase
MVYKSLPYLDEFVASAAAVASRLAGQSYELIFVVDGSPDDSLQHLRSKQRENPRIVIVDLSRNFGHHQAAWCGLHTARGDLVFIIDCDLEVSPAVLEPFAETMTKSGADVVYGYQESRRGGIASKYLGDAFWRIFNLLSTTRVPHSICTERLMSRRYVDTLLTLGDRNLFLAGMYFWAGFEQVGVKITKQSRKGRPVYTVFRRFQLMVRAISAFSSLPLQMSFWVGLAIALGCVAYGMVLLVRKIVHPDAILSGFTTLALLTSLSAGMIMMSLGVIGLYISRIYSQTQNRPVYLIRSVYRSGQEES